MSDPQAIALALLVSIAAWFDVHSRRVPNWLTLGGVVAALGISVWQGTILIALGGMALALAVYVPLFALEAMGGGDVKLMAAVGALAGPGPWFSIFLLTALTGGILAIAVILYRRRTKKTFRNVCYILSQLAHGRRPSSEHPDLSVTSGESTTLPHAVTIALGVLSYLLLVRKVQ